MNIQPIVEGYGEVEAIPVLLRRLQADAGQYGFGIGKPIRRTRHQLITENELRRAIQLAKIQKDCGSILIVFDADTDCPKTLVGNLMKWALHEAGPMPCQIVIVKQEYEAWFLGSIESLRGFRGIKGDAVSHPEPEAPANAKAQLEMRMAPRESYHETTDQPAMSSKFDFNSAYNACRSFRKLVKAFSDLAAGMGFRLEEWPENLGNS